MKHKYFDLNQISLSSSGKVISMNQELEELDNEMLPFIGGAHSTNMSVSTNLADCKNNNFCGGSVNANSCK